MSSPVALFWDLDGTLLSTARAGVFAIEAAVREVYGREPDITELRTAGLTDASIAALLIEQLGEPADEESVSKFLRVYERELPRCLPMREGYVMPNVREILDDLAGRDDVLNLLLTGNTRAGAHAKLTHYGLIDRLDEGAFCVGPGERAEIARAAVELAAGFFGAGVDFTPYVIGDTTHDVACGKAVGARTIAVATGPIPLDDLAPSGPWKLLAELPPPEQFRALISLS